MRLWSFHPQYLDSQGLVAVWREGLLAKKVLTGQTQGYTHHPQLLRFKQSPFPHKSINSYLIPIYLEATKRGYQFNQTKINFNLTSIDKIKVNQGQLKFEWNHLLSKLKSRNYPAYRHLLPITVIQAHPLFIPVAGGIEAWEKNQNTSFATPSLTMHL